MTASGHNFGATPVRVMLPGSFDSTDVNIEQASPALTHFERYVESVAIFTVTTAENRFDVTGKGVRRFAVFPTDADASTGLLAVVDAPSIVSTKTWLNAADPPASSYSADLVVYFCPANQWTYIPGDGANFNADIMTIDVSPSDGTDTLDSVNISFNY
jgi:hypothetical protein